jgi:predicted DNA-binding transcriptional regulator AlpA
LSATVPSGLRPFPAADEHVTAKQLGQRLSAHPLTIHRWAAAGLIPPPVRIGRSVRWRWLEVQEYLAASSERAGATPCSPK